MAVPPRQVDRKEIVQVMAIKVRWRVMDVAPDYDASDEIEYFISWLPWALRGAYPPPAYPPV